MNFIKILKSFSNFISQRKYLLLYRNIRTDAIVKFPKFLILFTNLFLFYIFERMIVERVFKFSHRNFFLDSICLAIICSQSLSSVHLCHDFWFCALSIYIYLISKFNVSSFACSCSSAQWSLMITIELLEVFINPSIQLSY